MIDTHMHFENEDYNKIDDIITRAKEKEVNYFILSSTSNNDIEKCLSISNKYSSIFVTLGYHPEVASEVTLKDLKKLDILLSSEKVVGIGEIGLDYHYDNSDEIKEKQKWLFIKQLELAEKHKLPVVVHSRDAISDTYDILKKYSLKGIIHCYSGSLEMALKFIGIGFKIGIGGVLTFNNSKLKEIVKQLPKESFVLETDSPYLSPIRGSRNEPFHIYDIALYLSHVLGISIDDVKKITFNNTITLFNLENKL